MSEMTSRARVLAALKHEEPDKAPIDFGSTRSTGINAIAYNDLKQYLGIVSPTKLFDVKQLMALPEQAMMDWAQTDVIGLHRLAPSLGLRMDKWKPGTLPDGSACLLPEDFNPEMLEDGSLAVRNNNGHITAQRPKGGLYFDEVYAPLADAMDEADLDKHNYPEITDEELVYLTGRAKDLYENTNYAINGATGISLFEKGLKDFGYEEWMVRIMTEPDLVRRYLERLTKAYITMMDRYLGVVGQYVQVIQANDDLGMQTGPLISPKIYHDIFLPFHKEIFQHVKKQQPGIFVFLHSCGSVYDFIPDLIEAGVDALNPVQTNAAKMDARTLKREFGKDITFWGGGCSTQTTLTFGSADDVRREVEEMIEIFKVGGGFVFNQVHNIQAGVTPQNIVALYKTAQKMR